MMKYVMLAAAAVLMFTALGCNDEKSPDTGTDVTETSDTSPETTPSDTGADTGDVEDTGSDASVSD